jgi:diguanylate cyclase (GGDEF)-like protein
LALARAAGDAYRSAQSWSLLAYVAALSGDPQEAVSALLAQAARSAERTGDPGLRIRILINEAAVARLAGDARVALARTRSALSLARSAGLQQPQVTLLNNLADAQLRLRQPRQALRTVEEALPLAERLGDTRVLHALRNNAGLARIGLGQIEEGKRDMQLAEALLGENGASGQRVEMLREFGEALAAAGDARGALELYRRERALAADISRENLEAALREIQASFDAEVRQRDLSLLQDQIATRNDELASQDLTLRIWLLLFALLGVLLLLGALVYSRLRGRERLLSERRERLRRESEQDPLTGLGNRRAFEARMRALANPPSPVGALLLLDIDRFKQINDRYGHASGDVVLIEVARRIQACLRRDDLVVRWGGEEFLVHVSAMGAEQALILARRILERIAGEAIELSNGSLRTTASLGLCMDALPGSGQGLHWEERLRLADLALYAAKSRGRNRAVGVVDCSADVDALRAPEIDFEAAERSGLVRVQSVVIAG